MIVELKNESALLHLDLFGGALTRFELNDLPVNPFTFAFTPDQMPKNNRKGTVFQGHFACIGRWGEPSPGEKKCGMPDHGSFANNEWQQTSIDQNCLVMEAVSEAEGLSVQRHVEMHPTLCVFRCTEKITNIKPLGRFYNIVQHPTIAASFLQPSTRVFCNAGLGYHYSSYNNPLDMASEWPVGIHPGGTSSDLSRSNSGKTAVHSFIVREQDLQGWLCAYSPDHQLILGYVWNRSAYPWINMWCDFHDDKIRYRGLEFGTTGMHQPFPVMLASGNTRIFNEPVLEYIDAGATISKTYTCFLCRVDYSIDDIGPVLLTNDELLVNTTKYQIRLPLS